MLLLGIILNVVNYVKLKPVIRFSHLIYLINFSGQQKTKSSEFVRM